ncbi:MAG TPA: hypothetical protein VFC63_26415 [Blastocatellia bacterium]|nr:hypothetical protein [Blastocatellia bacterium]
MKVGIIVGREQSFPPALIDEINGRESGVTAEYVTLSGIRIDQPLEYAVIIDRISHEIPFYRAYLKQAALQGTRVINNPFWWSADDKFFNYSLATKIDVAVPKTILLPQKSYKDGVVSESLRNLEYPLNWQGIVDYIGMPAIMKPFDGGGWRDVYRVDNLEDLISKFDETGQLCMTLQEFINFDRYVRCYCIGRKNVWIMPYDPRLPYGQNYVQMSVIDYLGAELKERIERDCITLCEALGYDMNTVEFAIRDGIPYAIDYMNPAPDAELRSVKEENFRWMVNAVADLAIEYAKAGPAKVEYSWSRFLNPRSARAPRA